MHNESSERRKSEFQTPRRSHEFPAEIVRAGGRTTKVTYKLQCTRCQRASLYEGVSIKADNRVAEKFVQRGWLLGRTRDADICPFCLTSGSEAADTPTTNKPGEMVLSPAQRAEQLFMPPKKGERGHVVVEVQGSRSMSRARHQAEVQARSIFAASPSQKPVLGLGGSNSQGTSVVPVTAPTPQVDPARPAAPVAVSEAFFERLAVAVANELRGDISALTNSVKVAIEQIGAMVHMQDTQVALLRQNNEATARIVPRIADQESILAGNMREFRELISRGLVAHLPSVAAPATETEIPASENVDAGGTSKRVRRTKAEMEVYRAEQETLAALGLKRKRGRPPKGALTEEQLALIAASENPQVAKAALESREWAEAEPSEAPADVVATAPVEAAQPKRRGRPPKASVMAATPAASGAPVEAAQPKRRGRPPKASVTAEAPADFAAPEAPVESTEPKRRGRPPKAAVASETSAEIVAPAAPVEAAQPKRRGRPPKASVTAEAAADVAAPEAPVEAAQAKRRGRPPKAEASEPFAQLAAPTAPVADAQPKRRGRPPKAAVAAGAPAEVATSSAPVAASEPKRRGRPPKAAPVGEASAVVAPPAVLVEPAQPKRRGRPPKAAAAAPAQPKRRGRPPKAAVVGEVAAPAAPVEAAQPKRRGRPPKAAIAAINGAVVATASPVVEPKRRGRPPKSAATEAPAQTSSAKAPSSINWSKIKVTADVMVLSKGGKTTLQIGRQIWEAAGFASDAAVHVLSNGPEMRISKAPGGTKPKSTKGSSVSLTVPNLGDVSLWQVKYAIEGGSLFLKGKLAS